MTMIDHLTRMLRRFAPAAREGSDELFTEEQRAVAELMRRRRDVALEQRVHTALGEAARPIIDRCAKPTAILFRQIASPTYEALRFLETAKRLGLQPLFLEYHGDKFVTARNPYKHHLGKMPIEQRRSRNGSMQIRYHTLLDFPAFEGDILADVRSLRGERLIDVHHRALTQVAQVDPETVCVDGTAWFATTGSSARAHYEGILPLFVRDAILFENYLPSGHEGLFVRENVLPAFRTVTHALGAPPLIVRLLPKEEETAEHWDIYPHEVHAAITS